MNKKGRPPPKPVYDRLGNLIAGFHRHKPSGRYYAVKNNKRVYFGCDFDGRPRVAARSRPVDFECRW